MVDHNRAVGTAGTMTIRDAGGVVTFVISCGDGATSVGSYTWSGVVNGAPVGGTINLPAGFGARELGSWVVSTSQTVTFHQNATGTSGLGGAADHAAAIDRAPTTPIPPSQPPLPTFLSATPVTLTFGIGNPPSWGSGTPLTFEHQVSLDDFSTIAQQWQYGSSPVVVGGLTPAVKHYYRYRAVSTVGPGPWSYGLLGFTAGGLYVSDGTAWALHAVDVSNGTAWVRHIVEVSDGLVWKASQ
jgi:hypothetical protein